MNKIFTSLIITIAIWAGATLFVGSQMENNIQEKINQTNKQLKNSGVQYRLTNYKKNFLNSDATIEVKITDPLILELIKDSVKLPITLDYKIEHGPLFFKNNFGFGVAKIDKRLLLSSLLKKDVKKEFLTLVKDDVIITNSVKISFNKNASYKLITNKIDMQKDEIIFHMTPLTIQGTNNIETLKGKSTIDLSSLELKEKSSKDGIKIKNLTTSITINEFIENLFMLGKINISIGQLLVQDSNNPNLNNMNLALNLYLNNKRDTKTTINSDIEGEIDFKDTQLPLPFPSLQKIDAKMNLEYLGLKGLITFQKAAKEVQKAQEELFSSIGKSSNEEFEAKFSEFQKVQKKMVSNIIEAMNNLLIKDKTKISYQLNAQTKDKEESRVAVDIGYTGDMKFQGTMQEVAMNIEQNLINLIKCNIDLQLNKKHLNTLPDTKRLKQQIQMGIAQGFIKENSESYLLKGYYNNQELVINDNNLTALILPFLMMAKQP